jgi:hypothetical protein
MTDKEAKHLRELPRTLEAAVEQLDYCISYAYMGTPITQGDIGDILLLIVMATERIKEHLNDI